MAKYKRADVVADDDDMSYSQEVTQSQEAEPDKLEDGWELVSLLELNLDKGI